jgi:hypothetical protein
VEERERCQVRDLLLRSVVGLAAKEVGMVGDDTPGSFGADSSFAASGGASLAAQRLLTALRGSEACAQAHTHACGETKRTIGIRWELVTPADLMAADTPRRMIDAAVAAAAGEAGGESLVDIVAQGALSTREMFAVAAEAATHLGIGMWDHECAWRGPAMINSGRPEEEEFWEEVEHEEGAHGNWEQVDDGGFSSASSPVHSARGVLMTGATGLLGRRLMRELLARMSPHATLMCLVRAEDDAAAAARLTTAAASDLSFEQSGGRGGRLERERGKDGRSELTPPPPLDPRIRAIAGDAAAPWMGLSRVAHAQLADDVDLIVHSAGRVSAVAPYAVMAASNVAPTVEAVRLALCRPGLIALHHVSSSAALPPTGTPPAGGRIRDRDVDEASWGMRSPWSRRLGTSVGRRGRSRNPKP